MYVVVGEGSVTWIWGSFTQFLRNMALDIYFRYILELMVNQGHDGNLGLIDNIVLFLESLMSIFIWANTQDVGAHPILEQ